jgi:hypothetical protein
MTTHNFQIRARSEESPTPTPRGEGRLRRAIREIRATMQTDLLSSEIDATLVNAITMVHAASGEPALAIYNLRFTDNSTPDLRKARDGQKLSTKEIPHIASQILRDNTRGRLESDSDFFVHFGWDHEICCGTNFACRSVVQEILQSGLTVSVASASPYYQGVDRSDWPGQLQW